MATSTVPNQHSTILPHQARVALVGEAPGVDEVREGKPFVGFAGQRLDALLSYPTVGIIRAQCLVANVMQVRPPTRNKKQLGPLDKWTKTDEGDKKKLQAPMTSIIQIADMMIDSSMKNLAMREVVDLLGHPGA